MAKLKVEIEIQDAYDVQEAAVKLKVGVATVWRWISKGKLSSFKVSGRTLISAKALSEVEMLQNERAPGRQGALNGQGGGR